MTEPDAALAKTEQEQTDEITDLQRQALANMPEELIQWFATGSVVAERYGMTRFEIRHRVVEVIGVLGGTLAEPRVIDHGTREFKTWKAATAYRDRLVAEGKSALIQNGTLVWTTEEEDRRLPEWGHRG